METRLGLDDLPSGVDPILEVHWVADRGHILVEVLHDASTDRLFFDGEQSIRILPDPQDSTRLNPVFIQRGPPDLNELGPLVLPELLGLTDESPGGHMETILAADGARIDPDWSYAYANYDVSVLCPLAAESIPTVHLGFDLHHGTALAVRHHQYSDDEYAAWIVDDWLTVEHELTGERVSVPSRGRSIAHSVASDGTVYHQVILVEVHEFNLPSEISRERFAVEIPIGTEVWHHSEVPGRPPVRSVAGGAAGIELQAAEAARRAEAAMAELRGTGVTFSARPQQRDVRWLFLLIGVALVGGGFVWSRWHT